jgi:uridine kinase
LSVALAKDELIGKIVEQTLELIDRGAYTPIILIDGRAGSGKTTLAAELQQRLFSEGETLPRIIHMDDLYPGWDGLAAGVEYLNRQVLRVLERGETASWQTYNWQSGQRDEWKEFSGGTPLIVEGVGALNTFAAERAQLKIWLEVDEDVRHERWTARDGHKFDDFWAPWAAQELDFYAANRSPELADFTCSS